jgi:glycosyltransferase involved in cell wall biosynthesis
MSRIAIYTVPIIHVKGGIGYYIDRLLENLIPLRPNDEFVLYSHRTGPGIQRYARYTNVRIEILPAIVNSEVLWSQLTLAIELRRHPPDIFWGGAQIIPLLAPRALKTVLTIHDFVYCILPGSMGRMHMLFLRIFGGMMYRRASICLPVSDGTAKRLTKYYDITSKMTLPPAIAKPIDMNLPDILTRLTQFRLAWKTYFLFSGTVEPRKNLVQLLHAYRIAQRSLSASSRFPLVLVGGSGWNNVAIKRDIEAVQAEVGDNLRLLGFVDADDLQILQAGARCLVMPSIYEGYGMPLAEARNLGTDVICTDIPEMREAAGYSGFFINTIEDLVEVLVRIIQDPSVTPPPAQIPPKWLDGPTAARQLSSIFDGLLRSQAKGGR